MMKLWDASPAWLKGHGLTAKDAQKLFNALSALADYEGPLKDAAMKLGARTDFGHALSDVCDAIRYLVDGE